MSQSYNSNTPYVVCHSGNAHVRGKIRRVWRPRYLEVLENGLVRYYDEVPKLQSESPTRSRKQQQQQNDAATKVIKVTPPKCTLVVVPGSTRILDVTTLRDMHIGLPRGSYGFVFRGQKLITTGDGNPGAEIQQYQVASAESAFVGEEDGIPTLLSPSGSMSSLQHLSVGCYPNAFVAAEPRDFLCAVATLEEAQMWVVALQWAALPASTRSSASANNAIPLWASRASSTATSVEEAHGHPPSQSYTVPSAKGSRPNLNIITEGISSDRKIGNIQPSSSTSAFYYTSGSDTTAGGSDLQEASQIQGKTSESAAGVTRRTLTSKSSSMSTQETSNVTIPMSSNYIVSKVIKYRTVRIMSNDGVGSSWKFEVAYEIHGLLIHYNSPDNLGPQQQQARDCNMVGEHWSMLRTASDFQVLIQNLCKELGPSLLDRAQLGPIKQLPRWQNKPSPTELYNSLSIVDSILRSLVMDAAMVNAQSMKAFLGLLQTSDGNDKKQQSNLWFGTIWNLHDPESVLKRSFETIPSDVVLEQYVKQWLLRKTEISSRQRADVTTLLMQRPQWIAGGIGFTSLAIVPWASYIGGKYSVPTVTIRFDFLVASWVGAAYLGNKYLGAFFNKESDTSTKSIDNTTNKSESYAINKSRNNNAISPNMKLRPKIQPSKEPYVRKSKSDRLQLKSEQPPSDKPSVSILPSTTKEEDESSSLETEGEDDDGFVLPSQSYKGEKVVDERNLDDGGSSSSDEDNEDDEGANVSPLGGDYLSSVSQAMYANQLESYASPLPQYDYGSDEIQTTCWSQPISGSGQADSNQGKNHVTFYVRGSTYLQDRIKIPSGPPALHCRGIDIWLTDNPERHIARHPAMLGGRLHEEDTFLVNFLLPFGNFVAYFSIPPLSEFPNEKLRNVWSKFLKGDQQYRDARLKLLPVVVEGPWIVKTAVGPGKSPALLGKVIPLQYFFRDPDVKNNTKGVYEVDVIITASTIAKGILSVVKGHTKSVSLAFAFIIEASEQEELPETVLCSCQIHSVYLEHCPILPSLNLDEIEM